MRLMVSPLLDFDSYSVIADSITAGPRVEREAYLQIYSGTRIHIILIIELAFGLTESSKLHLSYHLVY